MKTSTLNLIKQVAKDYGYDITNNQAKEADKMINKYYGSDDYYYGLKEYFLNF